MPSAPIVTWARIFPLLAAVTPRSRYWKKERRPATSGAVVGVACASLPGGLTAVDCSIMEILLSTADTTRSGRKRLPPRRPAQRPERYAADQVGCDRGQERDPITSEDVENPPGGPGAECRPDPGADRDHAQDGPEVPPGEEIGGLRGDRRAARAPGQTKEARVEPEEPRVLRTRDEERADHADDRDRVGQDGRELAPDVVRDRSGDDRATDGEKAAHAEHAGGIELVEARVHRECELVQRDEEASEACAEIDREQEPEVRRGHGLGQSPVAARRASGGCPFVRG